METEAQYIEFFSKHRDTLYRLILNICGNGVEAEDIVQDVFEKFWRARDKVLQSSYPKAYICRMAHNLAIDRERTRVRHKTFTIEENTSSNSNDTLIELSDIKSITQQAIASLPEKQRLAIHLRDIEGYEIEEIAEAIGCDNVSARMNLSRARKSIRERIINAMNYGVK